MAGGPDSLSPPSRSSPRPARRSHRIRSSSSTAARRSTSYRLVGGRRLRRLCARARPPHGQIHPRQPGHRAAEHAGRGGNKAAGYVYSVAPKDGTAIGALFPGGILAPLLGDTPIQHDPAKFILVGSANSDVYTCVVRTDSPIKSFKERSRKR